MEGTNSLPHPSSPGGTQAGHVPISPKDTNSGQGAKEILGAASGGAKERALRKANAFLGAWSRNFSKPAIIVPSLGESEQLPRRRDGSPVQPVGTAACAEHPLPSVPRGPGCFLCNSATAKHPTEQETRGFGWFGLAWHPGLVHNGHFPPPPSFLSSVKFPPGCTPAVLRIQMPRQLEKLPKARRGKPHNPSPVPPVWPCLCKAGSRLCRQQGSALCAERKAGKRRGCPVRE